MKRTTKNIPQHKKNKFIDSFFLSPIAGLIFIVSLCLSIFLGGWFWKVLAGLSLFYITMKWLDFESGDLT